MPPPPWADLPPELAVVLRPVLPSLSEEVIAAIRRDVDDYRRPLTGEFGRNVRGGVVFALGRFLDLFGDAEREATGNRDVYVQLGRGEFIRGRSLDALLTAYRVGARVSWRRFVEAGRDAGVDPEVLFGLGEAMFAYIDGLSAESTEGYAAAQSEAAGERARERRRLVRQLLQDPPPPEDVIAAQAGRAGWALPDAVAALATPGEDADALASRLGAGVIAAVDDGVIIALVPDPDAPGRRAQLAAALAAAEGPVVADGGDGAAGGGGGTAAGDGTAGGGGAAASGDGAAASGGGAALGPTVAWPGVAMSAARARLGLRLAAAGELLVTDDHLADLVLRADPALSADLAGTALAPLAELPAKQAAKLTATLRAWLDHHGRVEEVASALGVHPQTVRYRVNQLRERLPIDDPDERFALALALRAGET